MATRRTLDSLVKEFASWRGVSGDNAIRIALTEAIEREEHSEALIPTDPPIGVIRKLVLNQICLARIETSTRTFSQTWEQIAWPLGIGLFCLTVACLRAKHLGGGILGIDIFGIAGFCYYFRVRNKHRREDAESSDRLKTEIKKLGERLPSELEFLSEGTSDDLSWLASLDDNEES